MKNNSLAKIFEEKGRELSLSFQSDDQFVESMKKQHKKLVRDFNIRTKIRKMERRRKIFYR